MTLTDSAPYEEKTSFRRQAVAGMLALFLTAGVFAGYLFIRNRHAKETLIAAEEARSAGNSTPRGPAKAHILVDEALLKGGQTIIGGSVKNISRERLSGIAVELELKRRKDAITEKMTVALNPAQLEPEQEGRYSLKLPAQRFSSVRLVGLTAGPDSATLFYTTGLGQKRPLERLEPKVVIVPRSPSSNSEFLNSPDNPARVP